MDVWVIYQPNHPTSVRLKEDAVASITKHGHNTRLLEGVSGAAVYPYFQKHRIQLAPCKYVPWNQATMGCFASHHTLWRHCVEQKRPMVVMEHDGVMVKDPTPLLRDVEHVCHLDRFIAFDTAVDGDDPAPRIAYENNILRSRNAPGVVEYPSYRFYGETTVTGDCFVQAYGYLLMPEGARRLLAFVDKHGAHPADKAICRNAVRLQRSAATYVKYHPLYDTMNKQRNLTTRV